MLQQERAADCRQFQNNPWRKNTLRIEFACACVKVWLLPSTPRPAV
ncbi:hypothetical protein [Leptolyngbya ohadii]|nr:hypothetical protein [Leptolyngbya ohadii]